MFTSRIIMSKYQPPRSDAERLSMLKRSLETGQADRTASLNYLEQDILSQMNLFIPRFSAALEAVGAALGHRSKEVREKDEAVGFVQVYLRDFWEVLKRRVNRENQPAEVLTYYKLPLDGTIPTLSSADLWLTQAASVAQGDGLAVAAGYETMANPSAAKLQEVLAVAIAEVGDVAGADRVLDQAQERLALLRGEADTLLQEVMAQLRFQLRKKDESSQRRIMRSYGALFTTSAGEPTEEVVTPDNPVTAPEEVPEA